MRRALGVLQLLALLLAEVGAVVALVRLGRVPALALPSGDWGTWLAVTAPEDALMAALRLVALGCAAWLLGSTALYVIARLARLPGALAALEWATLPAARRVADRALAVLLTATATVGSGGLALAAPAPPLLAAAQGGPANVAEIPPLESFPPGAADAAGVEDDVPPPVVAPPAIPPPGAAAVAAAAGSEQPVAAQPEQPGSAGERGASGPVGPAVQGGAGLLSPTPEDGGLAVSGGAIEGDAGAAPSPKAGSEAAEPPATTAAAGPADAGHVVVPGDHLWRIARERVAAARGLPSADVADRDVHGYWIALIDANRGVLRSGDPDLVFPGEQLLLPPVPPA